MRIDHVYCLHIENIGSVFLPSTRERIVVMAALIQHRLMCLPSAFNVRRATKIETVGHHVLDHIDAARCHVRTPIVFGCLDLYNGCGVALHPKVSAQTYPIRTDSFAGLADKASS